jgi:hypothetical protein
MTARVWRGKCLRMRPGKGSFRGLACSPEVNPVPSGAAGSTDDQDGVNLAEESRSIYEASWNWKVKKEISGVI